MSPLTAALVALLALAALPPALWPLIRRRYRLATPADELHLARTEDGWDLALHRYLPREGADPRDPVILCHGMLTNRFNVDLYDGASLARHLRGRGFDVWVMELRGHGLSRPAGTGRGGDGGKAPVRFDWSADDYIVRDAPAALRYVRAVTGRPSVHWFGHSLGGMILYALCARGDAGPIRSAALTDAPASLASLRRRAAGGRLYARLFRVVPPALVLPFLGPAAWAVPWIMARRYGMADRRLVLSLLANAIIPWGSSKVLLHFCRMLEAGRFQSMDGAVDYERGAARIDFPLLVIAAGRSRLTEESIRSGVDRAPAADKRFLRLQRFTHSSLLVGPGAPEEVFPLIADWFERHSAPAGPS